MKTLQTQVEALEQKRSKWLVVNLIGFCIWDGARIIDSYILDKQYNTILTGIILLGGLFWMISLIQILRLGYEMKKDKQVLQVLIDELIQLNRFKAWRIALVAVGLAQVFIILLASFVTEVSGILAAEVSIFVLVISALGGFLYYNGENGAYHA